MTDQNAREMTWSAACASTSAWALPSTDQLRRAIWKLHRLQTGRAWSGQIRVDAPGRLFVPGLGHVYARGRESQYAWAHVFWFVAGIRHAPYTVERRMAILYDYAVDNGWPGALATRYRPRKPKKSRIELSQDRVLKSIKRWERKHKLAETKLAQLRRKKAYYEREVAKRVLRSDAAEFIIKEKSSTNGEQHGKNS